MEKENNTSISGGDLIEIGQISYDYQGSYDRCEASCGTLFIKYTLGVFNILLKTTSGFHVVVAGKREKWGKSYNAYFKIRYSENYLNLPDNLIDVISSKK
ncbi:MAG: hypothetical protein HDT09_00690 [Bacteroidales bacterium]|nr:hypothetical protein [Bacteroidales bacterium]